ncbi:MAG: alpha/beta hydrolase [Planctomycetes bacterium]|nr:alpha/beta hydrolase [Planctomycetota bacterium]
METRSLLLDGDRITVHVTGRGPVALLIHGYPLDHRMWLDTLRGPLAQQHTLVAVDLRGHGQSPWCGDAVHTMERFADDLAALIRVLSDDPIDVVGLSMGGYVALSLWADHEPLVRSLVLCDTKATADDDAARAGRAAAICTVLEQGRGALAAGMTAKLLAPGADDLLRARVHSMIEGTPVETIVADLRGLAARPDRTALLPTISVPTLVVVGEHDAITPRADADVMVACIPDSRLLVARGAGHMTPMEAPDEFAKAVGELWATRP